ncbi:MAG TPA: M28 family peptidase [Terriglobales bacterium]|nr:M28 family peptidase [Terriglobales bacterium]
MRHPAKTTAGKSHNGRMRVFWLLLAAILPMSSTVVEAQQLLKQQTYQTIRDASSGELPYADFKHIIQFPGFSPSPGADQVANYLASQARSFGLADVNIEHFPANGQNYFWAFRANPSWEVRKGQLWLETPERELLADYQTYKGSLARFSQTTSASAELVDVGAGTSDQDYAGKTVAGKIVLASGSLPQVMRKAVWEKQALGVVDYRTTDAVDHPDLISSLQITPWIGPHGEKPTFAFSLSYREGKALDERLAEGEHLTVHAEVEAATGAGAYPEVIAKILGTDPSLTEVLVYAHDNSRDSGGANNLTGVGCTLDVARLLSSLISSGRLPRPRRTIRFMWGPEHDGITYHFHEHPEDIARILAMVNIDMIGYSQEQRGAAAVFHLYRSPYSNPSFIDDVVQAFVDRVGKENTISLRNAHFLTTHSSIGFLDPLFAPTGSHDEFHYNIEPFWGPSDHEDAQTFGVRAVLLNDYPDYFLGTQDDSPAAAGDPTQMRRGVTIGASTAYFLASASPADLPSLLQNAFTKAEARLAEDQSRADGELQAATSGTLGENYFEARNVVLQGFAQESTALKSLSLLAGDATFQGQAAPFLAGLQQAEQTTLSLLEAYERQKAQQFNLSGTGLQSPTVSAEYRNAFPARTPNIRGAVNIFRPRFGRWWLIDKTGDEHFDRNLAIAKRGEYTYYEALNLANGTRSVAEIRDVLSAEFEPIPNSEVYDFFKFMEGVGVVKISSSSSGK